MGEGWLGESAGKILFGVVDDEKLTLTGGWLISAKRAVADIGLGFLNDRDTVQRMRMVGEGKVRIDPKLDFGLDVSLDLVAVAAMIKSPGLAEGILAARVALGWFRGFGREQEFARCDDSSDLV